MRDALQAFARGDAAAAKPAAEGKRKEMTGERPFRCSSNERRARSRRCSLRQRRRRTPARPSSTSAHCRGPANLTSRNNYVATSRRFSPQPAIDHAFWSVAVAIAQERQVLFSLNPARMQTPASNQKLITSAVAADRLGWDYRYSTQIYATGPSVRRRSRRRSRHRLERRSDDQPATSGSLGRVRRVGEAALTTRASAAIGGQLIGDDNAFAEPGWGLGWAWDDLALGYGAAVGALQYNENQVELLIGPGLEAGGRAIISVSPPGSGIIVDHQPSPRRPTDSPAASPSSAFRARTCSR